MALKQIVSVLRRIFTPETNHPELDEITDVFENRVREIASDGVVTDSMNLVGGVLSTDIVTLRRQAVARVVRATIDTALSGVADVAVTVGGLTGLTETDFASDDDGTEFFAWLDANKESIPATEVVDNTDGTGDITFEAGAAANDLETSSEDEALTFEETTEGADAKNVAMTVATLLD